MECTSYIYNASNRAKHANNSDARTFSSRVLLTMSSFKTFQFSKKITEQLNRDRNETHLYVEDFTILRVSLKRLGT